MCHTKDLRRKLFIYACHSIGLHLILITTQFAIQNGINQPCKYCLIYGSLCDKVQKTSLHDFTLSGFSQIKTPKL